MRSNRPGKESRGMERGGEGKTMEVLHGGQTTLKPLPQRHWGATEMFQ